MVRTTASDRFDTIQEGINAVADGGTVYVAAGFYAIISNGESFPITVDSKTVILVGEDASTTTIGGLTPPRQSTGCNPGRLFWYRNA